MSEIREKFYYTGLGLEERGGTWLSHTRLHDTDIEYHLAPRWVSVEDQLPIDDTKEILVSIGPFIHKGFVRWTFQKTEVGDLPHECFVALAGGGEPRIDEYDFWMYNPLPAPPKENTDELG